MKELLLGSWGPQLAAYYHQYPAHVIINVLGIVSIAIMLMFGRPSLSGNGDFGGFGDGGSDGDGDSCGD
jgi:hypothetical protein